MVMLQSSPMKRTLRFEQLSCRLSVDGLPDVSVGHGGEAIGIITGWSLQWPGRPLLEGKREHLMALLGVVLPYARHLLSGVGRPFGDDDGPVRIEPNGESGHTLLLHSSQPDVSPLSLELDDAELADLVRVLDQLRIDPRMQLAIPVPEPEPLKARDLIARVPKRQRLAAPLGAVAALVLAGVVAVLLPEPRPASAPGRSANPASSSAAGSSEQEPGDTASPTLEEEELVRAVRTRLLEGPRAIPPEEIEAQAWQLEVSPQGDVLGARPLDGASSADRARLGLPARNLPEPPPEGALLLRADFLSNGSLEIAPWHGWGSLP
jgi:hypothetical protein